MMDQSSQMVGELINSCYRSHEGFRSAAEAVSDANLKRLLGIYAQQRTRFAEELRDFLPHVTEEYTDKAGTQLSSRDALAEEAPVNPLEQCLESDRRTLALYREALANRTIPTRAHFLISAQCFLLQRVHDRMYGLLSDGSQSSTRYQTEGQRV